MLDSPDQRWTDAITFRLDLVIFMLIRILDSGIMIDRGVTINAIEMVITMTNEYVRYDNYYEYWRYN